MKILTRILLFTLLLFLPAQLGKHFWLSESLVVGRRIDYLSPTLYLTDLFVLSFVGLVFWSHRRTISRQRIFSLFLFILLIFFIWVLPAIAFVPALYIACRLLFLVLFALSIRKLKPDPWQILMPLGVAVIFSVFLALLQFFHQGSLGGFWYFLGERRFSAFTPQIAQLIALGRLFVRPYATFPHPNVLGGFLVLTFPLFFSVSVHTRIQYFIRQAVLSAQLVGIFLSFSRAAWLVIILYGVYCLLRQKETRSRGRKWLLLLFVFVLVFFEELVLQRFINLASIDMVSVRERLQLQQAAIALFLKSPLAGVGFNNFIPSLPTVSRVPYLLQPVHSVYLLVLAETGLLGVLSVFLVVVRGYRSLRHPFPGAMAALVLAGLLGLVDHYLLTIPQTQLLLALLTSLLFISQ